MTTSRRDLLKAAGFTILAVGGAAPMLAKTARAQAVAPAPPGLKGKSFGLAIDTEKCEECSNKTACVDACHTEFNVPDWKDDPEEEVKWIWKEHFADVFPGRVNEYTEEELKHRPTLVLCNHCAHPPCVKVCPTGATFKREDGPVMMDMHRCIGCRYCIVGCPYGARSFNWKSPKKYFDANGGPTHPTNPIRRKGVVEKCTLCPERLAKGEPPACVEACASKGNGALTFGDLADSGSAIRKIVQSRISVRRKAELGTSPQVFYTL